MAAHQDLNYRIGRRCNALQRKNTRLGVKRNARQRVNEIYEKDGRVIIMVNVKQPFQLERHVDIYMA